MLIPGLKTVKGGFLLHMQEPFVYNENSLKIL